MNMTLRLFYKMCACCEHHFQDYLSSNLCLWKNGENLKCLKLVARPAYFTHTCLVSTSNNCETRLKQNDGVDCMHCRNSAFAVSFGI